jgi:hypothetical protein
LLTAAATAAALRSAHDPAQLADEPEVLVRHPIRYEANHGAQLVSRYRLALSGSRAKSA